MAKITVIIPAYNASNFITRTIRSVQAQTENDWEINVVDDGSTDRTGEVVESLAKDDRRIKLFRIPNWGAPARPKNFGLKEATGQFIAFLDHDDEWMPQKLEKQVAHFDQNKEKSLGLVATSAFVVNEIDGSRIEHKMPDIVDYLGALLERNYIFCSSGVMVKREVFDKIGNFDENFRFGDDWDMWLRISREYNFGFVKEPLYNFYRHPRTVTSNIKSEIRMRDYDYGLNKHLNLYKERPKQFGSRLLTVGRICYISGDQAKGIYHFLHALMVNPADIRIYANILFSLFGSRIYQSFIEFRKR